MSFSKTCAKAANDNPSHNFLLGVFLLNLTFVCRHPNRRIDSLPHLCASLSSYPSLKEVIRRFLEVEEPHPPPRPAIISIDDERCDQHFRSTHSRTADGRYKWSPPINIGESSGHAKKLLDSLSRRLKALRSTPQNIKIFFPNTKSSDTCVKCQIHRDQILSTSTHHPVFRESSKKS